MAKAIFKVFLNFIKSIVDIFLFPVNALVVNLFPDLSILISTFNNTISTIIGNGLGYFAHLLPPVTKVLIVFYLTLLIGYYTVTVTVHLVLKVIVIIKKLKIW